MGPLQVNVCCVAKVCERKWEKGDFFERQTHQQWPLLSTTGLLTDYSASASLPRAVDTIKYDNDQTRLLIVKLHSIIYHTHFITFVRGFVFFWALSYLTSSLVRYLFDKGNKAQNVRKLQIFFINLYMYMANYSPINTTSLC